MGNEFAACDRYAAEHLLQPDMGHAQLVGRDFLDGKFCFRCVGQKCPLQGGEVIKHPIFDRAGSRRGRRFSRNKNRLPVLVAGDFHFGVLADGDFLHRRERREWRLFNWERPDRRGDFGAAGPIEPKL